MKEKPKELEKKNLIITGVFLVSIIIILFGGALIYNKFFYKKSYSEVENIMSESALEYFEDHKNKLPLNINDSITLKGSTLIKNDYMKDIESYLKIKGASCDGEVIVTNINGNYRYTPFLDCGKNYQTKKFVDYINDNVTVVTSGDGLYNLNNSLVYRGDKVNNYLKLNGQIYRIVKFVDGHPVIIHTDKSSSTFWDDRYNIEKDNTSGINNYEISKMREYLDKLYNDKSESALLSEKTRLLVTQYDLPIGKRCNDDTDKTGALENAKVLTEQYIGLLPIYDFMNASIDANCTNTISKSCSNYNYLSKYKNTWWTVTANSKNTYKAYQVSGSVGTGTTSSNAYVRPVFYLAKDVVYVSGTGEGNNPFIVK